MKTLSRLALMLTVAMVALPFAHADELESAVKRGKPDRIRAALAAGVDLNKRYSRNQTALHLAAERGYLPAVQLLVLAGADINAQDSNGDTPMHVAVTNAQKAALRFLLEYGADYRIRNSAHRDLDSHAERAVSEQRQLPTGNTVEEISRYISKTLPTLPPPRSPKDPATMGSRWGTTDPDDTITVTIGANISKDQLRNTAKSALDKDGWLHVASEPGREIGSFFDRKRDREYRAEIVLQDNAAKISYLRGFDSRHDSPLRRIRKNLERNLKP